MFDHLEQSLENVERLQHVRMRNYILVALTEKLGETFLDDASGPIETLAEAESWLVAAGARLDPLPDDDMLEHFGAIVQTFIDFEGPWLLFDDVADVVE